MLSDTIIKAILVPLAFLCAVSATSAAPAVAPAPGSDAGDRIIVRFPKDKPVGKLSLQHAGKERDTSPDPVYCLAVGDVSLPRGKPFVLQVNYNGARDFSFFNSLPPHVVTGLIVEGFPMTDAQFVGLKNLENLTMLDLKEVDIGDAGMARLKSCKSLLDLRISQSLITGRGLAALKDLKQLTSLNLDKNRLGMGFLVHLKGLTNLVTLRLGATEIGDGDVANLRDMKSLRKLILGRNSKITDASIPVFLGLTNLKRLDCTDCKISAAGLMRLKALPRLKHLQIAFKDYRPEEVERLKKALAPDCTLVDGRDSEKPMVIFAPLH
ncbi:MAG: hypothetical protein JSS83_11010 [Cyanobacteria bacterium SZAS LIN-3]|nr:hypothetical protein [Cyanobacteria bacterium SZAS LIN-3]MBS2006007.1 hypothetical protein [Cyanobacteria bacterium SZAS TMP-1]